MKLLKYLFALIVLFQFKIESYAQYIDLKYDGSKVFHINNCYNPETNQLDTLCTQNAPSVIAISFNDTSIKSLIDSDFRYYKNIGTLHIGYSFPTQMMDNLEVDLSYLSEKSDTVTIGFSGMENINYSKHTIKNIPDNIKYLYITAFYVDSLTINQFPSSLKTLSMEGSGSTILNNPPLPDALEIADIIRFKQSNPLNSNSLTTLYLSIAQLPFNEEIYYPNLQSLEIYNDFEEESLVLDLPKIEKASFFNLSSGSRNLNINFKYDRIKELQIRGLNIRQIKNVSQAETIIIENSDINIHENLPLSNLKKLYLVNTTINPYFPIPDSLKYLVLTNSTHTTLSDITDIIPGKVDSLYLNNIAVDNELELPENIKLLSIHQTGIKSIPIVPSSLISLKLTNNTQLSCIGTLPKGLQSIELVNNQISCIPSTTNYISANNPYPLCSGMHSTCNKERIVAEGILYIDANYNGFIDEADPIAPERIVRINNNKTLFTDSEGHYQVANSGINNYYIKIFEDNRYYIPSPDNEITIDFRSGDTTIIKNFLLQFRDEADVSVIFDYTNPFDYAFLDSELTLPFRVGSVNPSKYDQNATIKFVKSPFIEFISASLPGYIISNDTIIWQNIKAGSFAPNVINVRIPNKASLINETFSVQWIIEADNDVNLSNNQFAHTYRIFQKPFSMIVDQEEISRQDIEYQELIYSIATSIYDSLTSYRIYDTIPDQLDISTFRIINESDEITYEIIDEKIVEIRLQPDLQNGHVEPNIKFGIKPKSNLTFGDTIINSCLIYMFPLWSTDTILFITNRTQTVVVDKHAVHGKIYLDKNNNGIIDINDIALPNAIITNQDGLYSLSDPKGQFIFTSLNNGSHIISAHYNHPDYIRTSPESFGINYHSDTTAEAINFLIRIDSKNDVRINGTHLVARQGMSTKATAFIENLSLGTKDGLTVKILKPADWMLTSAQPAGYAIFNDTIVWTNISVPELKITPFTVTSTLPATAEILGAPYQYEMWVENNGDVSPENNYYKITDTIIGSYDPNDKIVNHTNLTPEASRSNELIYTIRFQNTGTDTAFKVVIIDTITGNLEPGSIRIIGASHDFDWSFSGNGIATFIFDNILLPASNINEPGSHGFVTLALRPDKDLVIGDSIFNKAGIYFDFNEPVFTNTATTKIATATPVYIHSSTPVFIHPNPARERIRIEWNTAEPAVIRLSDISGKIIRTERMISSSTDIDISQLPKGIYIIQLQAGLDIAVSKLVVQ